MTASSWAFSQNVTMLSLRLQWSPGQGHTNRKVTHVAFIIQSPAWAPVLRKYYFLFLVLQTMQLNTTLPYFKNMAFLVTKTSLKVSLRFFLLASSVLSQTEAFGEK